MSERKKTTKTNPPLPHAQSEGFAAVGNIVKLPAHLVFRKELSLLVWKPHGILDEAIVNEIVGFIETAERRTLKSFNRFTDMSELDMVDLNFKFVFTVALFRRLS